MDKRQQLIKSATKLFVENGFEHTPTSKISKEAGVATGTLFTYFKSKEDLINKVYFEIKKEMHVDVNSHLEISEDIVESFRSLWINLMNWGYKNPLKAQFMERFHGSVYVTKISPNQLQTNTDKGTRLVEKVIKNKLIKNLSFDVFESLTNSIFYSFVKKAIQKKKLDKNFLELSWNVYWDAIRK